MTEKSKGGHLVILLLFGVVGGSSSRVGGLEDNRMEVEEGGNKERRSKSVFW